MVEQQVTAEATQVGAAEGPLGRSWERCRRGTAQPLLPDVGERWAGNPHPLRALVAPFAEDLYQFIHGVDFAILVSDSRPLVLEVIGTPELWDTLEQIELGVGADWSEARLGTTALSLALIEAQPIEVAGFDHWNAQLRGLACASAPLFDLDGGAIGTLTLVSRVEDAHPHSLGMVVAAAQAIHHQIHHSQLLSEASRDLDQLQSVIEAMSDGVIVLDEHTRICRINNRAGSLAGLQPRAVAGRHLQDVLPLPPILEAALSEGCELVDERLFFPHADPPLTAFCSTRIVKSEHGTFGGVLLLLRPDADLERLALRTSGGRPEVTFNHITGESRLIQAALREARIAANASPNVLVRGEAGSGKELFARAIHNASRRRARPFVVLNCADSPRSLLESELFGWQQDDGVLRPGRIELSNGGTLFLENVWALPPTAQTRLLRTIEMRTLLRAGHLHAIPVDVRIICADSGTLEAPVAEGRFRADLYHLLSGMEVSIPPLRLRGDDVLLLIEKLLVEFNLELFGPIILAPDALAALRAYHWPGNVRELEVTLEQMINGATKAILSWEDLPLKIRSAVTAPIQHLTLTDAHALTERDAIVRTAREHAGNLDRTASALGISRTTLWRKMRRLGLDRASFFKNPT